MTLELLRKIAGERFGHASLRPGQQRVFQALLDRQDVLAILPTAAGKSLVYQVYSQVLDGPTLVVSPLLALMRDQVDSLSELGVPASFLNGTLSSAEAEEQLRAVEDGSRRLLYVTPERLEDDDFVGRLRTLNVALFVVDEAHCISEWGHDFRPAYLRLGEVAQRLDHPQILALTATATPWVRDDVVTRLRMREPRIIVRGIDRPNLFFEVNRLEDERQEKRLLRHLLAQTAPCEDGAPAEAPVEPYSLEIAANLDQCMAGSGIIYTATTHAAEETAGWLGEWGIPADFYHGRRAKKDRARVQEQFMSGELRVIAATNAFGLGVDNQDVRFVIHRDIPSNLEAYYQEAGRAGRDGAFARCTLIYRPTALGRAAFLGGGAQLTHEHVARAGAALQAAAGTLSIAELQARAQLSRPQAHRLVELLKRNRLIEERRGRIRLSHPDFIPESVSLETELHRKAYERSRLDMVRGYAELRDCRRQYILNYFGEESAGHCGRCDVDVRAATTYPRAFEPAAALLDVPFAVNDRVLHASWGEGVVQRVVEDSVTVLFATTGYRVLDAGIVQQQGILTRLS